MNEKQIDLKDLLFYILNRWKILLVAMVVGGVFFGIYGYISIQNEREERIGDTGKNYLVDLSEEEAAKIAYFIECEKQYLVAEENFENSIIQKMDESNIYTLNNVYTVISDDIDRAYIMEKAYEQCLESNEFYKKVAEVCSGVDVADVPKFFSVKKDDKKNDTRTLTFTVSFWFEGKETCEAVSDVIKNYINELAVKFTERYGEGSIEVLSGEVSKSKSDELVNSKLTELLSFQEMKEKYLELKKSVTKEQIQIYKKNEVNESVMPYVMKVVMGMILLLAVVAVVFAFKYVMDKSIKTESDISDVYNIPVLGIIKSGEKNNAGKLISTQIAMICQKDSVSEIGIVSCDTNDEFESVIEEIASTLRTDKINATVINGMLHEPEEMLKITGLKGAVLVATLHKAKEDEFKKVVKILKRQGVEILGCIVK